MTIFQRFVPADGILTSMILLFIGKKNWGDQSLSINSGEWDSSLISLMVEKNNNKSMGPWLICDLSSPCCCILLSLVFLYNEQTSLLKYDSHLIVSGPI